MEKRVCVTGAGGFLASWVVKLLLSKGYTVHGTVRDPNDEKYSHLNKLDGASENLKLFKADLLDYDSLESAIQGCSGVLHVACPVPPSSVPNPEVEILEPALKGTLNVLKACSQAKVKRVVYVSSVASVMMNPNQPDGQVWDETCWSDKEYCKSTGNWYCYSKTEAESAAFEYGKQNGLDVVSVCPSLILGPILQSTLNSSTLVLVKLVKGTYIHLVQGGEDSVPNRVRYIIDVRDAAEAIITAYEEHKAEGRYICTAHAIKTRDLAEKLGGLYPEFTYPKNYSETSVHEGNLSSERLQKLGWTYRPLEETLVDSIESYREAALLD
ncbi:hypothetical protein SAY86_016713 [Trapa natans]|uniref:NAD-dependent epimerase/dehydratase domain-containing protein n=1 Tax=Trapa natans TaxID=22666 RepID=A0AAN7QZQ9_TRANT|nr:hypothetical protein SAY86_016713 [Trapa natans]